MSVLDVEFMKLHDLNLAEQVNGPQETDPGYVKRPWILVKKTLHNAQLKLMWSPIS